MLVGTVLLVLAVFAACVVEAVEALTIVLAVGLTRGWRAALQGVASALVLLAVAVAAVGPALHAIPLDVLRLVIGGLLLLFGVNWMRKAVLRASGRKALHDEDAIFRRERAAATSAGTEARRLVDDWYGFTLSFKGVLLEGVEVVFIVLTFGANQGHIALAAAGALAAAVIVAALGFAVRRPLARVPENTLKFGVAVLLCSFGLFWTVEGAGAHWPGDDAALPVVIAAVLALAVLTTAALRVRREPAESR